MAGKIGLACLIVKEITISGEAIMKDNLRIWYEVIYPVKHGVFVERYETELLAIRRGKSLHYGEVYKCIRSAGIVKRKILSL